MHYCDRPKKGEHKTCNAWLESISNGQIWGVYRPKGAPIDHNLATKSVKCPPSPGGDNFPPLPRARGGRRRCPFVAK